MKNKNIHQFDSESIVSLKNMLFSTDQTAVQIGLDLLKNADLKHDETVKQLQTLAEGNIMELTEMAAEVMKDMFDLDNETLEQLFLKWVEKRYGMNFGHYVIWDELY